MLSCASSVDTLLYSGYITHIHELVELILAVVYNDVNPLFNFGLTKQVVG
jgi:hypothetical protein